MERLGIVRKSTSPWAFPIVMVRKKDDTWRFCIDYRELNKITLFDNFPIPRVDETLEKIGRAKYISCFDLSKGYWQLGLDEDAITKSAFVTPFGNYEWTRMPMGMLISGSTFVRAMKILLTECDDFAVAYIDDLTVCSETWELHLQHMHTIFHRLNDAQLTVKPRKCVIGCLKAQVLVHIVGDGKISPQQSKVDAILNYDRPTTKKGVRALLGLAGYYRRFVHNFAAVTKPLTELTKKNAPETISWEEHHEKAFARIKTILSSNRVLNTPDFDRPFILQTDASQFGIGAVLSQFDDNNIERPVCYLSKKLKPAEINYSTIEKECLAIAWAVTALEYYLLGRKFTIQTDHKPLVWLEKVKGTNRRLLRWSMELSRFCFETCYRRGYMNGNADALSRSVSEH